MAWTETEKDQFFKALSLLAETMGEPLSPVRLAGYCAALEDAPFEAVTLGLGEAMKTCRFFPKPVEIRELGLESRGWRRHLDALADAYRPQLPAPLPDEVRQANIERLNEVLRTLTAPKVITRPRGWRIKR